MNALAEREPRWLARQVVDYIHQQQIKRFGGSHGTRDSGLIESALARARNKWEYGGERDIIELAAAYGYGLATNHGYVDGNKRVAYVAMTTFLQLNGRRFTAPDEVVVTFVLGLAAGEHDEADVAVWLRKWAEPTR